MVAVGIPLALWTLSGAMQTIMWALNIAYEKKVPKLRQKRLIALAMIAARSSASASWSCC